MITEILYPSIWKAFKLIDYDNGVVALRNIQQIDSPKYVTLEGFEEEDYQRVDKALSELSDDDFETFCIGEEEELLRMAEQSTGLTVANRVLAAYFDSIGSEKEDEEIEDEEAWSKAVVESRINKEMS